MKGEVEHHVGQRVAGLRASHGDIYAVAALGGKACSKMPVTQEPQQKGWQIQVCEQGLLDGSVQLAKGVRIKPQLLEESRSSLV